MPSFFNSIEFDIDLLKFYQKIKKKYYNIKQENIIPKFFIHYSILVFFIVG